MRLAIISMVSLVALTGCDIINPQDPRLGEEAVGECVKRVTDKLNRSERDTLRNEQGTRAPTYTYDITKLDLEAVQELLDAGGKETAGSRGMRDANETSTAVERFMATPVDEKGAFFLGRDPALYRVRGAPTAFADIIKAGCERQQADMRLIEVSWGSSAPKPATVADTNIDPNELDSRGEPMEYDLKVNPQDAQTD